MPDLRCPKCGQLPVIELYEVGAFLTHCCRGVTEPRMFWEPVTYRTYTFHDGWKGWLRWIRRFHMRNFDAEESMWLYKLLKEDSRWEIVDDSTGAGFSLGHMAETCLEVVVLDHPNGRVLHVYPQEQIEWRPPSVKDREMIIKASVARFNELVKLRFEQENEPGRIALRKIFGRIGFLLE